MTVIAPAVGFDTLTYVRRLKAAGVDEAQAEAHAEAVRDAVTEGVATKADLDKGLGAAKVDLAEGLGALRADLDKGLGALKADLDKGLAAAKVDLADLETRLTVRFVGIAVGIVLANAGLTFALLKLLPQAAP